MTEIEAILKETEWECLHLFTFDSVLDLDLDLNEAIGCGCVCVCVHRHCMHHIYVKTKFSQPHLNRMFVAFKSFGFRDNGKTIASI